MNISLIIPTWNEAARIESAVRGALDLAPAEVIVVDGGSQDDTLGLAARAGARVFSAPRGRAAQQNHGARQACGDVFVFLHADTSLPADGLIQVSAALASRRVAWGAFRQRILETGVAYRVLEWGNAWRVSWRGVPYGDQAIFVRREIFERVGGFPDVRFLEDVILSRALRRIAWPVLLPGPLSVDARRWRERGVARQTLRNWTLLAAWRLGASPDRLARFYGPAPADVGHTNDP